MRNHPPGAWKEELSSPVSSLRSCLISVPVLYSHGFIYYVFGGFIPLHSPTPLSTVLRKQLMAFWGKKAKHQREGKSLQNGICCIVHELCIGSALRVRARAIYRSGNVEEMTDYVIFLLPWSLSVMASVPPDICDVLQRRGQHAFICPEVKD